MPACAPAIPAPIADAGTGPGTGPGTGLVPTDGGRSQSAADAAARHSRGQRPARQPVQPLAQATGQQARPQATHQGGHAAEHWRHWLLAHAAGYPNDAIIASMLASQRAGRSAMPDWLGLTAEAFQALIAHHFPALRQTRFPQPGRDLDPARAEERDELVRLLLGSGEEPVRGDPADPGTAGGSAPTSTETPAPAGDAVAGQPSQQQRWMARILAAGCLGSDHLWQDLGLRQRAELSLLMAHNFPALAQRNHRDMKWKRFLYKQLCETEGIHTCRSPSCEVCVDYHACFGPEN